MRSHAGEMFGFIAELPLYRRNFAVWRTRRLWKWVRRTAGNMS